MSDETPSDEAQRDADGHAPERGEGALMTDDGNRRADPEVAAANDGRARARAARDYVLVRHRHNWSLLMKFSIVGGSGYVVNLAVFSALLLTWGSDGGHAVEVLPLGVGDFNVRNYHVFSMLAFFVANASNYLLNRHWTFGSRGTSHWMREYLPFLTIGLFAQGFGLLILTSFVKGWGALPETHVLVAQAAAIVIVTPLSFVGNKLWTFGAVRARHRAHLDDARSDGR